MILDCIKCTKKFEVNASLIPDNGRTIQCGSCNHVWFYKPIIDISKNEIKTQILTPKYEDNALENKKDDQDNEKSSKTVKTKNLENLANTKPSFNELINENKKTTFSVSKFLSYFLVFLITFTALIIVLDTFKSPLSSIIPGLEIFLYNFFETLKDLYLFIKNLLS
ncbi:zinc-ribbon domain-containing protein [Candidatus Pelagibacter bacterium]|nr:zinc-ribbon domain-containing protein [Candidatus Pelagibacter bacterium]